jgi:hypothetical protein
MATPVHTLEASDTQPAALADSTAHSASARPRMSTRNRVLFFLTAWLIVLMPFLFWWGTWFGRQLSDKQIAQYLRDDRHPRHIQHALVQIGERLLQHDAAMARWYPELTRLAAYPVEQVRNTDAWVMGQDTSVPGFHDALLTMLQDSSPMVRGNAALSLVRFGDATGRPQIVALLQPAGIVAPSSGRIIDLDKPGTFVRQGGLIAKIQDREHIVEVRSPISGRLRSLSASTGSEVRESSGIATVDPAADQAWEALRALYLVGQPDDLPAIRPYERELAEIPDRIREQAQHTEDAIQARAKSGKL